MRTRLLAIPVILALWASTSQAGLDLSWNDCVIESSTQDLNFTNCATSLRVFKLYGSFKVPQAVPTFFAADLFFIFEDQSGPSLSPFWRFDDASAGGCNAAGLQVRADGDQVDGLCASEINPWGFNGSQAQASNASYAGGYNYPCRGRLTVSIARSFLDPFPLESGVNYYMCHLILNTSGRASCSGCGDKVAIYWNSATLYGSDGGTFTLAGPDKLGDAAAANHAFIGIVDCFYPPCPPPCAATPVLKESWTRLKSIYR